jgi:hypothetical protein
MTANGRWELFWRFKTLKMLLTVLHQLGPFGAGISEVCSDLLLFGMHKNSLPLTGGQLP